jgi:hypothetical protein
MSISSVSSASTLLQQTSQVSAFKQIRQDFQTLSQALASGNLSAAQQAYATLQSDMQNVQSAQSTQQSSQTSQSGQATIQSDLSAVGQALSSGNLTAAQSAFATLQQDMQSAQQSGQSHHHRHHTSGTQTGSTTQDVTGVSATGVNTTA